MMRGSNSFPMLLVGLVAIAAPPPAAAQVSNEVFQAFFNTVCGGAPSGALATRCGETPGGSGDLSGDSQVSLNPNQVVASQDSAQARARQLSLELEERLAARRREEAQQTDPGASLERLGLIFNARGAFLDRDREFDNSPAQADPLQIERGFDGTEWSLQLGADYRLIEGLVLGGLFAYTRAETRFNDDISTDPSFVPSNDSGNYESDSYFFTLFGSYAVTENLYVDGSVGGGVSEYTFRRNVVFQDSTRTNLSRVRTEATPDGHEVSVAAGVGYDHQAGALSVGPYARTRYVRSNIDGFNETDENGSGLDMSFDDESQESLVTLLGLRASYALSLGFGVLVPQIRAEWEHEFERDALDTTQTFVSDTLQNQFTLEGDDPDRDYFNLGAGASLVLPGGWMAFVDYEGLIDYENLERHQVSGGLRYEFQ